MFRILFSMIRMNLSKSVNHTGGHGNITGKFSDKLFKHFLLRSHKGVTDTLQNVHGISST